MRLVNCAKHFIKLFIISNVCETFENAISEAMALEADDVFLRSGDGLFGLAGAGPVNRVSFFSRVLHCGASSAT